LASARALSCLAALLIAFAAFAQQPEEIRYRVRVPENWHIWVLANAEYDAFSYYLFAGDNDGRAFVQEKIAKGELVCYESGDMAVADGPESDRARHVRLVSGPGKGGEGWIDNALMDLTPESRAYLEQQRAAAEKAAGAKRRAAQAAAVARRKAADEAERKELAYRNSLPKLVSQGDSVVVATSMDCAKDLQNAVAFGRKNGTGVEFRKKMLELVTLGCATAMDKGTPIVNATRNGQFVLFTAYPSGKAGVALMENVRWP
jgi:hypothetical protein